jgi:hypothetical protein
MMFLRETTYTAGSLVTHSRISIKGAGLNLVVDHQRIQITVLSLPTSYHIII